MRQDSKEAKYTQLGTATRGEEWGERLSQPGNTRGESTLRSAMGMGQNAGPFILGRTHRRPVTCQLTQGALLISLSEFLQFCDAINSSLGTVANRALFHGNSPRIPIHHSHQSVHS